MLSPGENASPRVKAENRGHGNQFLTDGPGDQNVATDSGVVYSIGQLNSCQSTNQPVSPTLFPAANCCVVVGIPPIGHLSQLLEGAKNWSQGPTCVFSRPCEVGLGEAYLLIGVRRRGHGSLADAAARQSFPGLRPAPRRPPPSSSKGHGRMDPGKQGVTRLERPLEPCTILVYARNA